MSKKKYKKYTIDFTSVNYYLEMHAVIWHALDFPDYYGCNFDALWDCLTGMVGRPVYIEIIGIEVIEEKFDGAAEMLLETLKEFKHYEDDEFVNDIRIEILKGDQRIILQ